MSHGFKAKLRNHSRTIHGGIYLQGLDPGPPEKTSCSSVTSGMGRFTAPAAQGESDCPSREGLERAAWSDFDPYQGTGLKLILILLKHEPSFKCRMSFFLVCTQSLLPIAVTIASYGQNISRDVPLLV